MWRWIAIAALAITVYGLVDCIRADRDARRGIPPWAWIVLIIVLPGLGAIIWLISSRMGGSSSGQLRRGPVAPDDDPEFLRELEWRNRRRRAHESEPDDGSGAHGREADDS